MEFRHEWKRRISHTDVMTLEHRLATITRPDIYSSAGSYQVHSLLFDTKDHDTDDQSSGIFRETFRIRYYNDDLSLIKLEKIMQYNGISTKESCEVTREFVETILYKSFSDIIRDPMGRSGEDMDPLIQEFYWKVVGNGLRPKVMTDYDRRSFRYHHGEVKVSIDYHIRSEKDVLRFLLPQPSRNPSAEDDMILNLKWGKYLPEVISSALALDEQTIRSF